MTTIQNLIISHYDIDKRFIESIKRCMHIKELDLYLQNLDKQATLHQNETLSASEIRANAVLESENKRLLRAVQGKIQSIQDESKIDLSLSQMYIDVIMQHFGNDIDIAGMEQEQYFQASKILMIVKIMMTNNKYIVKQEKTL